MFRIGIGGVEGEGFLRSSGPMIPKRARKIAFKKYGPFPLPPVLGEKSVCVQVFVLVAKQVCHSKGFYRLTSIFVGLGTDRTDHPSRLSANKRDVSRSVHSRLETTLKVSQTAAYFAFGGAVQLVGNWIWVRTSRVQPTTPPGLRCLVCHVRSTPTQ